MEEQKNLQEEQPRGETSSSKLGTQPVGKLLLKLSIPTITAQLVNALYNIVDRIYIGHMPDSGSYHDYFRLCLSDGDRRSRPRFDYDGKGG